MSVVDLRKRVKELRVCIVGSVSSAGVEELQKEIAYHESAKKSAERDAKRMDALGRAREAKVAKSKAKKEVKPEEAEVKKAEVKAEVKPKEVKAEKVVLSKNIRVKKVNADE